MIELLNKINKLKGYSQSIFRSLEPELLIEAKKIDMVQDIFTPRDIKEKFDSIKHCATILEVRQYGDDQQRVHNANFCHNPTVCPVCADRVSKRRRAIYHEPIIKAAERYKNAYLLTLTIEDSDSFKDRIDVLTESKKRFRKMGQKRVYGKSCGEYGKVKAAICSMEIKKGTGSKQAHVHEHQLIFTNEKIDFRVYCPAYKIYSKAIGRDLSKDEIKEWSKKTINHNGEKISVSPLSEQWLKATGSQGINVDCRKLNYQQRVKGKKCKSYAESIAMQANEVLKYTTVLSDEKGTNKLSAKQYLELIQRRGTRRLFNTVGALRADKRNPDSLITMKQREIDRIEYVDTYDNKEYKIFSAVWNRTGYDKVLEQSEPIFKDSDEKLTHYKNFRRTAWKAQQAVYQGEYRKERNSTLKAMRNVQAGNFDIQDKLDILKDSFRARVAQLWNDYHIHINRVYSTLIGKDESGCHLFDKVKERILEYIPEPSYIKTIPNLVIPF